MKANNRIPYLLQPAVQAIVILGLIAVSACQKDTVGPSGAHRNNTQSSLNQRDLSFVSCTGMSNRALIELSQLALLKTGDTAVRHLALELIDEGMEAQNALKMVGGSRGATVPDTMGIQHMELKQQMTDMSGRSFDSFYVYRMVDDHTYAYSSFVTEIRAGADDSIQSYANKFLPSIQIHLGQARILAEKYK